MAMTIDQLHQEALALSPAEREELTLRLLQDWQSGEKAEQLSPEWMAEICKRAQEIESGHVEPQDAFEFLAELRAKFGLRQ